MLARRDVVRGLGALPLAAVLADPVLASAAAETTQTVSIKTAKGRTVGGSLALPDAEKAPAIILVHEWWGLNDQIRAVAAKLAGMGYVALAVDLMKGEVATTPEQAKRQMDGVKTDEAVDTMEAWYDWLQAHDRSTGQTGIVGWCFGGGWSLYGSIVRPMDATVVYYGNVARSADELSSLKGPVMGHFATRDNWINEKMVGGFEAAMKEAGKDLTVFWYEADHAFANPTGARYDKEDAAKAWERTTAFFEKQLKA